MRLTGHRLPIDCVWATWLVWYITYSELAWVLMVDCCDIVVNDTVLSTLHGGCEAQFWNKNATKVSSPVHGNVHSLFPTMKMWFSSNMAHSKQTCRVLASSHLPSDLWNNDTGFHPGRCSGAWLNNLTSLLLATGRERKKKTDSVSPVPLGKAGGVSSGHMHYKEAHTTTDFQGTTTGPWVTEQMRWGLFCQQLIFLSTI